MKKLYVSYKGQATLAFAPACDGTDNITGLESRPATPVDKPSVSPKSTVVYSPLLRPAHSLPALQSQRVSTHGFRSRELGNVGSDLSSTCLRAVALKTQNNDAIVAEAMRTTMFEKSKASHQRRPAKMLKTASTSDLYTTRASQLWSKYGSTAGVADTLPAPIGWNYPSCTGTAKYYDLHYREASPLASASGSVMELIIKPRGVVSPPQTPIRPRSQTRRTPLILASESAGLPSNNRGEMQVRAGFPEGTRISMPGGFAPSYG